MKFSKAVKVFCLVIIAMICSRILRQFCSSTLDHFLSTITLSVTIFMIIDTAILLINKKLYGGN